MSRTSAKSRERIDRAFDEQIAVMRQNEARRDRLIEYNASQHGPKLYAALKGAQSALRKALPFVPPDNEGIYCGEWLDEMNAALALVEAGQ